MFSGLEFYDESMRRNSHWIGLENVPVFTTRTDDDLAASRPPLRQPKHSLIHKQKRDEKGKGKKKSPSTKKQRENLLNWFDAQKFYTRERA
jgi:hypothetical protein